MRLADATLSQLAPAVARPAYDRATTTAGIVHLGLGAFFRAHCAVAIEDCLAAGARDWGIVGASLRGRDVRDALAPQDGLYTLAIRDGADARDRVIGAVGRVVVAPEDPGALLAALADPRIRLVTLTITEKGYGVDPASGRLRPDDADLAHDLARPDAPRSALGFLTEAIRRRRAAGVAPFTILSCDNLAANGTVVRRALADFAGTRDGGLARFIEGEVACPCCVVDRIVPATTDRDRADVAARSGLEDAWPVVGEAFFQWVIEDTFPSGRPPLERAGATFVADVAPYERMKLRLLNGAHSTLAAIGRLAGFATVAEAVDEPAVRRFLDRYWAEVATTSGMAGAEIHAYTARLLQRFGNRALPHLTAQIAVDALAKLPQRMLAPLRERCQAGRSSPAIVFAVAAVIRSCGGRNDTGRPFPVKDAVLERWSARPDPDRLSPAETVAAFLANTEVLGPAWPAEEVFRADLIGALGRIVRLGVMRALDEVVAAAPASGFEVGRNHPNP